MNKKLKNIWTDMKCWAEDNKEKDRIVIMTAMNIEPECLEMNVKHFGIDDGILYLEEKFDMGIDCKTCYIVLTETTFYRGKDGRTQTTRLNFNIDDLKSVVFKEKFAMRLIDALSVNGINFKR